LGIAGTDSLEPDGLARCIRRAEELARHAPAVDGLPELPRAHRLSATADYLPATARAASAASAATIARLFHLCAGLGAELAGSMMTGEDEVAVANSSGVACYAASTVSGVKLVTMYRKLSGYASAVHRNLDLLHPAAVLKQSLQQVLHEAEPITLSPGTYEVILQPEAVAELVTWLGYTAFGAKHVQERTSFLAGRLGEQVMGRQVTIYDDGRDPKMLRLPFDFEGTPKRKVVLIDRGVASGIVYDTTYGARFGRPSSGHGMPPDDTDGPLPLHLAMAPGTTSVEAMIRRCARGLLIPRFHYVNGLLNPREALMTGLTREGTFLIEGGKIARPVTTLRFTQSILEAFNHVLGISKERRLIADPSQELGCALMPAMHLAAFAFTGRSES
jgi:predicted Zn-dependent protease